MARSKEQSFLGVVFNTLGWPLFWGVALCVIFYTLIHHGVIDSPLVQRYFAGHPVEYVETAMFFVGIAAVALMAMNVFGQFRSLRLVEMVPRPEGGQKLSDVPGLLDALENVPADHRKSKLVQRLHDALQHIHRKGTSANLDDELKHLSDLDAERQHQRYALVRIIIWATPMLGFLGTVIGITLALGNLSPESLVKTPEQAMESLLGGLSVAFDTTALALCLSVILMFCQFLTGQLDGELLTAVDNRVNAELVGRFESFGGGSDPSPGGVDHLVESVVQSNHMFAQRQAEFWNQLVDTAQDQWGTVATAAVERLESGLAKALHESVQEHASRLARAEETAGERASEHWLQLQEVLTENSRVLQEQQAALARHGDVLLRVMAGNGNENTVQPLLNGSSSMEETITNLAASINLLNDRLRGPGEQPILFRGDDDGAEEQAA